MHEQPEQAQTNSKGHGVGEMRKRTEKTADERRYLIYYTFGTGETSPANSLADTSEEQKGAENV